MGIITIKKWNCKKAKIEKISRQTQYVERGSWNRNSKNIFVNNNAEQQKKWTVSNIIYDIIDIASHKGSRWGIETHKRVNDQIYWFFIRKTNEISNEICSFYVSGAIDQRY